MGDLMDPSTGEVMQMYRRSAECGELFAALAKAQGKFAAAEKSGDNTHFHTRYATLQSVMEATRDGRAENNLALLQMPGNFGSNISVTTLLGHTSGQWIESTLYVAPGKFDAQSAGSVITYLRRYAAMSILGVAPEDDDGEAAVSRPEPVSRPSTAARTAAWSPFPSKVNPAVAPASNGADEGRAAFARINAAIKAAQTERDCLEIYDEVLSEWGVRYLADINAVAEVNADAVLDLKRRVSARISLLRAPEAAAAK